MLVWEQRQVHSFWGCALQFHFPITVEHRLFIAELAEHSSIIIQNSSNPSSRKNLDVWPYGRTTVQLYDCTRSYFKHAWSTVPQACQCHSFVQWSVHWAPSQTTWVSPGQGKVLCPWNVREKKNASSAFRLDKIYILKHQYGFRPN